MFPPELVELIIRHGWNYLSTSSHRHAYSMTSWMLVSRQWLSIVVPIFLRDAWATSHSFVRHIVDACKSPCLAYRLVGISDVKKYLADNCRSLTISVYQTQPGEYDRQYAELVNYVSDPTCPYIVRGLRMYRVPYFGIPPIQIATVVWGWFPNITSLHFVLVDCLPTSWYWDMEPVTFPPVAKHYPRCLTDLHITFAYGSPPPPLLVNASRGTFYPPRHSDLPNVFPFNGVKRLVVREANADFVAFFTTVCPKLEYIESTAEFGVEDLPPEEADRLGDGMVFQRLTPTTEWGITGSDIPVAPAQEDPPFVPIKKASFWRIVRRAFRKRT